MSNKSPRPPRTAGLCYSRGAANVNSQGRKPLETEWIRRESRESGDRRCCRPVRGFPVSCPSAQGLTPLAIDDRPSGAEDNNRRILVLAVLLLGLLLAAPARASHRSVNLDGTWQIAQGSMDEIPTQFTHTVPVPGLVDMAEPAFEEVGTETSAEHREAFWYRRTFTLEGRPADFEQLKIHKAKFGTRVYLNGQLVGGHLSCFTPTMLDVKKFLKPPGQQNELIIRVGGHRTSVPRSVPDGWDFEKVRYIPGIYDSVELIQCGSPQVVRVQTVPDIEDKSVRVVATLRAAEAVDDATVKCSVTPAAGPAVIAETATSRPVRLEAGKEKTVELTVRMPDCHLWSPEDPFLYKLETTTGADTHQTRFGMRSFRFDPKTKLALLNGKPYPMRGTNVCIYRFFEDPARGDRPWREEWVRRLHRLFKQMHWNSARYCIGFPPEEWYDIADEEGILIQDEFPIWFLGKWPEELKSDELVKEYTEWMQERWNHPCVVVWDAQNESRTEETGRAIEAVRKLDLSNRPWDNGWSPPAAPLDVYEAHPYPFYSAKASGRPTSFRLSGFATAPGAPGVPGGLRGNVFLNEGGNPIIINEYGWLWLNRDGSPCTLSEANYKALLGAENTVANRRRLYAKYLAAMTEFWRSRRQVAAVMHFCGLGYSRPGGETSDHFLDLEKLTLEPDFQRYVGDAFSPLAPVLDYWGQDLQPGAKHPFPVILLNDRSAAWSGPVAVRIVRGGKTLAEATQAGKVGPVGRKILTFDLAVPKEPGRYEVIAELTPPEGSPPVRSVRDLVLLSKHQREARDGIAVGRPVEASSALTIDGQTYPAAAAVDGQPGTRWSSEFADPQWIAVDLGAPRQVSRVELSWERARARAYAVQVSTDGKQWTDVFTTDAAPGGIETIKFPPTTARWVRIHGTKRATPYGYSLWELKVFP